MQHMFHRLHVLKLLFLIGACILMGIVPIVAAQDPAPGPITLDPGDELLVNCPTEIESSVQGSQVVVRCKMDQPTSDSTTEPTTNPTNAPEPMSIPDDGEAIPVTGEECPAWVHDRYTTTGPDGKTYATWHPAVDPEYNCYFDHEHGSDPRAYVGFDAAGMPAFGYSAAQMGMEEPHNGFKVYVTNDDLNGRAWMITLHQGTGSPRRALVQHHTLDWHISTTDGQPLVAIHHMADFGYASPNCRNAEAIPGSASGYAFSQHQPQRRSVPTVDCVDQTVYETWTAAVNIGGIFEATPKFDIDNATTVVNLNTLDELRFMCEFDTAVSHPNQEDCTTAQTRWTGNKRGVIHPGQYVQNNTGTAEIYTDVMGMRVDPGTPGAIRQFITTEGWDTRDCCGNDVVFRIQSYSNGVYIANPGEEAGSAQFGVGKHHWPN